MPQPVPCQVEASWQRSLNYGLQRDDDSQPWVASGQLKEARAENAWINRLAEPLLARLHPELTSHPSIMVLSDACGLVLETHGNSNFLHKAQRYALSPAICGVNMPVAPTPLARRWPCNSTAKSPAASTT